MLDDTLRFCPMCCQNVTTEPSYNVVALIILLCLFVVPGVLYYVFRKDRRCPICHTKNCYLKPFKEHIEYP